MQFHKNLLAKGSIPELGSSNNNTLGFETVHIATCNFLLFPPDKFLDKMFLN